MGGRYQKLMSKTSL